MTEIPRNVLVFHGTGGYPEENWFPWLKEELAKIGCSVFIPRFPNPDTPNFRAWLEEFKKYDQYVNEHTILIGHSLGGLFLLRTLEQLERPVDAAFFVGAPVGVKPIKFYDSDFKFSGFDFDWHKIRKSAKHFTVFHSDNNPYVSLGNGEKLARELGVNLTIEPNAGHFNAVAGYTRFPSLLDEVNKFLNS